MLYGSDYKPVPPADIVRRLKQINPALGLEFTDPGYEGGGHWAVTWEWPSDDERWKSVQTGEVPKENARDILARLPLDCDASQAYGYVVNSFRACHSREDVQKLLARVEKYNDDLIRQREDEMMAEPLNRVEVRGAHIMAEALGKRHVRVGPASGARKRGRPKGSTNKAKAG